MEKQVIGIDIGYGYTKATNGAKTVVFPSVIGDSTTADFDNELIKAGRGHTLEINGQAFFYGERAQKHSRNAMALFARERTEQSDLMRTLFDAAMVELGTVGRVAVCTGLPVDWFQDREALEKTLIGEHTFSVDGIERHVYVTRVVVVPQPFGSFFDLILDQDGKLINASYARGKVGIADIGTFTADLALSDGLEYIQKGSGSKTTAMSTVWRSVRDGIKARYGLEYELHQVDHILRNGQTVTIHGQDRDISDLVAPAIDGLSQQVIGLMRDRWGKATDFKLVILTGGGAGWIADQVKAVYPHARLVDNAHLGNLRGFYKYAARKFGR